MKLVTVTLAAFLLFATLAQGARRVRGPFRIDAHHFRGAEAATSTGRHLLQDLPAGWDWQAYLNANPDLTAAGILDQAGAEQHWRQFGQFENRVYSYTAAPAVDLGGGFCPDPQATVDTINSVRAQWSAAPLTWSSTLAASAQAWANQCIWAHSGTPIYGECLMKGGPNECAWAAGFGGWAGEYVYWVPGYNDFIWDAGHFTQEVWQSTQQVGCGVAACPDGNYQVCQFWPPGNMLGNFAANVGPQRW